MKKCFNFVTALILVFGINPAFSVETIEIDCPEDASLTITGTWGNWYGETDGPISSTDFRACFVHVGAGTVDGILGCIYDACFSAAAVDFALYAAVPNNYPFCSVKADRSGFICRTHRMERYEGMPFHRPPNPYEDYWYPPRPDWYPRR